MADVLNPSCIGRTIAIDNTCGCTLTKMSVTGLTAADIVNFGNSEIDLARVIFDSQELKMWGVPERSLSMLLKGKIQNIKPDLQMAKINRQSIIQPWITRRQQSFVNDNYFKIETGVPCPTAGVGSTPASAWDLTLLLGGAWVNDGGISALEQSFVVGSTLIVHTWDGIANKTALTLQLTILASVNADAGGTYKAKVTVAPNLTAAEWAALNAAEQAAYHPTFGVAQPAANNVADEESYCNQQRATLNERLVDFWLQTTRTVTCLQQSYEEVLDAIQAGKVNEYLRNMKFLDIAAQEKQKLARSEREWMNSVMYGQVINGNQTQALWRSLPAVNDPLDSTCQLGVKANALGFFTQLNNCNRVIDMAGGALSLDYIINTVLYPLKRNREADGDQIKVIDSMTNRYMSAIIFETMTKYYTAKFGVNITRYFKADEKIEHDGFLFWQYNVYDIQDAGVQWAVFVDDYFNDFVDSFNQKIVGWDFKTRANSIWFIDWSDVSVGLLKTNQAVRKWPSIDPVTVETYKCVLTPNITTYKLSSKTWTPMIERANRHLIIHNFTFACPIVTIPGCTVPQS
jgi:hypothetical protein